MAEVVGNFYPDWWDEGFEAVSKLTNATNLARQHIAVKIEAGGSAEGKNIDPASQEPAPALQAAFSAPTARSVTTADVQRYIEVAVELQLPLVMVQRMLLKIRERNVLPSGNRLIDIENFIASSPEGPASGPSASTPSVPQGITGYRGSVGFAGGFNFSERSLGILPSIAYLLAAQFSKAFATFPGRHQILANGSRHVLCGVSEEHHLLAVEALCLSGIFPSHCIDAASIQYADRIDLDGVFYSLNGILGHTEVAPLKPGSGFLMWRDDASQPALNEWISKLVQFPSLPLLIISQGTDGLPPEIMKTHIGDNVIRLARPDAYVVALALAGIFGLDKEKAHGTVAALDAKRLPRLTINQIAVCLAADSPEAAIAALNRSCAKLGGKSLDDIEGMGKAHKFARTIINDLSAWHNGDLQWGDTVRSLLLYGEPGTGKTYMAEAMANSGPAISFLKTGFAKWQSSEKGNLGTFLKAMRKDFALARQMAPCIMFIDEMDTFGARNDSGQKSAGQNDDYWRAAINGFLECLNSPELEGVAIVGACNNPDIIDPAIMRDGRLDLKAEVMLPGRVAVRKILSLSLPPDITPEEVIDHALGLTPAAIDGAVRKAKATARIDGVPLTADEVRKQLVPYPLKRSEIGRRVAAHEAGHAVVANHFNPGCVSRVVIGQTGGGAAHLDPLPSEGTIEDYKNRIAVLMAGRAAERLITGVISGGAGGSEASDLSKATKIAINLEARMGMGRIGSFFWSGPNHDWINDKGAQRRVNKMLAEGEESAKAVLLDNLPLLERFTEKLVEVRSMEREEIDAFFA